MHKKTNLTNPSKTRRKLNGEMDNKTFKQPLLSQIKIDIKHKNETQKKTSC